jgi:uncharacterized membrane protein YcaP (DUF421 family)
VWHAIFHLPLPIGEKVLRSVLVYVLLVVALRVAGKRELGQTNTLDLVVLLLVANAVQNGIIGNDLSVTGAAIGAATLFVVNALLNRGIYGSRTLRRLLEGEPTPLILEGEPVREQLRRQHVSLAELRAIARRQGFENLAEVHTAILETNGTVSMFKEDEQPHYHPSEPGGLRVGKRRRGPHNR